MTTTQEKTATAPPRPAAPAARGGAGAAPRSLLDGPPPAQEKEGGSTGMVVLLALASVFYAVATPVATAILVVVIGGWAVRGITDQRKARARAKALGEATVSKKAEGAVRAHLPGEEGGKGLGNWFWDNLAAGLGWSFGVGYYAGRDTYGGAKKIGRRLAGRSGRAIDGGVEGTEGGGGSAPEAPSGPASPSGPAAPSAPSVPSTPAAPSTPPAPSGGAATGPQAAVPPAAPSVPLTGAAPGGGTGPGPGPGVQAGTRYRPNLNWNNEVVDAELLGDPTSGRAPVDPADFPYMETAGPLVLADDAPRTSFTSPTPGRDMTVTDLAIQRLTAEHTVYDILRYVINAATGADRAALAAGNRARSGAEQLNATSAGVSALLQNAAELRAQCATALAEMQAHQEMTVDWMYAAERAAAAGASNALVSVMVVAAACAKNIAIARAAQASALEAAAQSMVAAATSLQQAIEYVGVAAVQANNEAGYQAEYREAVIAVAQVANQKVVPFAQAREITQESLPTDDTYVQGA